MLYINELIKIFGVNVVVDSVIIKVDKFVMVGIIGCLGVGKLMLLWMMNCLMDVFNGEIMFEGCDVIKLIGVDKCVWQFQCVMIFQQFNFVLCMDVVFNVLYGILNCWFVLVIMFNLYLSSDIYIVIEILDCFGIVEQVFKCVEVLLGGQ